MPPLTEDGDIIIPPTAGYAKLDVAETEEQRLRRQCIETIGAMASALGVTIGPKLAQRIMEHSFGVALQLLNKNVGSI